MAWKQPHKEPFENKIQKCSVPHEWLSEGLPGSDSEQQLCQPVQPAGSCKAHLKHGIAPVHKKQKIKWLLGEGSSEHTSEQGLIRHVFYTALTQTLSKGKWIHIAF